MAVYSLSKPTNNSLNLAFRPIKLEAEADDTSGSLTLVRMSARVYVNGIVVNNNNPIIQDPDLDQTGATSSRTKFTFDIAPIVRDYLSHDLQAQTLEAGATTSNSLKTIGVFYGGIYKNTSTNELTEASTLNHSGSSFTFYAVNAARPYHETQDLVDYTLGSGSKKFLTPYDADENIKIKITESYQLSGLYLGSTPDLKIWVNAHKTGGGSEEFYIDVASVGKRFDLGVGCANFDNLVSGDMHSTNAGTLPIIESDVEQYDVMLFDGATQISGRYRFKIDRTPHNYATRFTWKNRLGGFDSFTFDGAYTKSITSERETYERDLGYTYTVGARTTDVLSVKSQTKMSAYSGIINESQREILGELITSPQAYVIEGGNVLPIVITNDRSSIIDYDNNLFQIYVQYEYSYLNNLNV